MEKQRQRPLARLIQDEVKAQLKWFAMARTRDEFINHLVDVLSPALSHHYRATLGTVNNRTDQFADRLLKPTKAKGLDRRRR